MKSNELRIGNFVLKAEITEEISSIHSDNTIRLKKGESSKGCYHINLIQPIPLTEEWLIKFGFKKPAHSWNGKIFHLSEWDLYPLNWCVVMDKNGAVIVKKLKYVHQLQNLYFALTGEELTIK
jgi:hypothetical protein